MIRIVTTFSRRNWDDYVKDLLPASVEMWPSVSWGVWLDRPEDFDGESWNQIPGETHWLCNDPQHEEFMRQWNAVLEIDGDLRDTIGPKRFPNGWAYDAGMFCHKVFAMTSPQAIKDANWIIFLGSDVETTQEVTFEWMDKWLKGDLVYLGRERFTTAETDFVAVNLIGDYGRQFLSALRHVYTSNDLYKYRELCDGYVIARLMEVFKGMGADVRNLSEGIDGLDVFEKTILGERMWHAKGPRGKTILKERFKNGQPSG